MSKGPERTLDRRELLKSAGGVALGLSSLAAASRGKRRFVIVGVGSRSRMYLTADGAEYLEDSYRSNLQRKRLQPANE